jgi:exopolysaccharide production protein ExoZ
VRSEAGVKPPSDSPPDAKRRILSIQYLRAWAALMVVFHHARDQFADFPAPFHTSAGQAGVDLFFVISGFVMVFVTSTRERSPRQFLESRATRIVPIYWFYTLACFALLCIAPGLFTANEASARHLILSLLFVPHAIAATAGVLSPLVKLGWTLNYEVFFYVVFAASMFVAAPMRVLITTCILAGLIAAGPVSLILGVQIGGVAAFYTNQIIGEFALGMLIARAYFDRQLDWLGTIPAMILIVIASGAMILGAPYMDAARLAVFGLPAAVILVGALAIERRGAIGRWPLLLLIGDASYSLYLVQIFPIAVLRFLWRRLDLSVHSWPWAILFVACSILTAVLLALMSYLAIERPSMRWLRSFIGARKSPDGA